MQAGALRPQEPSYLSRESWGGGCIIRGVMAAPYSLDCPTPPRAGEAMCLLSEKGLGLCVTEDSWPRITEEAWQAGLPARWGRPRVCCELRICCSLGSLSGWEPGPTGLWDGGRKSGVGLSWHGTRYLGDCVCVCVCVGASLLALSVERVQVAGNRGGRKPRQSARQAGPIHQESI